MGTVSIVIAITLLFALGNLGMQLLAVEVTRRDAEPRLAKATPALEHPYYNRIDGRPRTRTDRRDLQLVLGDEFAAPDVELHIWPRDPRM